MISADKLKEIKNYLVKAQNPLIFFDDDPDGLCSFLILKQLNDHAKGIVIKSSPNLDILYVKKIEELSPDVVFVLDVPLISQDFIDNVHVPLVWLDHHPVVERKGVHYYNPRIQDPDDNSPTSYWAYKVSNNQETMWISVTGSIADWYIPDFFSEFKDQYPNLVDHQKDPASIIFETRLGELIRALSFLLKGKALDVRRNISIISKIKDPYDIIEQRTARGRFLHKQFLRIKKQYDELIEKAIKIKDKKMIIFLYPDTKMSFTSELSNELIYRNPDKLILVGREKGDVIKLSMRSTKLILPPMIEKALVDVKGYGGGHCLRGDTLIQLPDGNICEARELEINKEICSMNLSNYKLEKSFVNEKFKKNKREILKIKAKPYSIECSLDHNIFRFNKWGKIEEIPAKLLKKGDFVIGLRKINIIGNKQRLPLLAKEKAHIISTYNKYKPIKISKFMNKEFCQMYGYLIGDGNIYASDTVEFRDKDVELLKYYNKLIINQLGIKGKIKPIKNKDCYKLKIHSSLFAKLFEKINEGWSKNKQILPIIKRLQNKELSYFIKGLYDAEGCVGHHEISFSQKNKRFLCELQLLLLRYGIISHVRRYELFISENDSINLFNKNISFTLKRKKRLLNLLIKRINKKLRCPSLKYAILSNDELKRRLSKNKLVIYNFFLHPEREGITLNNLECIQNKTNINFKKELESDFMLCKIEKIEKIKINETLYDFNIPNYNNFIANGLLVHNSHACGGNIARDDFQTFVDNLKNQLK